MWNLDSGGPSGSVGWGAGLDLSREGALFGSFLGTPRFAVVNNTQYYTEGRAAMLPLATV